MIFIPFVLLALLAAAAAVFFYRRCVRTHRMLADTQAGLLEKSNELDAQIKRSGIREKHYETVLNGISEAVLVVSGNMELLWMNSAAKRIFNPEAGSTSLLKATGIVELESAARKVMAAKKPLEFKLNVLQNRRHVFFGASVIPLEPDSETNRDLIIILNDLTRLNKLEQVRKDFAANVSHELRTPIQLIKGMSETILEHKLDKKDLQRSVELIQKNAISMENLTSDLLTLVSLEDDGNPRPLMSQTNISSLISQALLSVNTQAQNKQITIKKTCPADLSAVVYGPLIVSAIINLLDNAIKYSPPSSGVKISASCEPAGELVIKVQDKGIGIPAEYLDRIFERFFRVDRARSRDMGTGLGLAIVRHIAILHNGSVEAESHAGVGSCFTLRIPRQTENPAADRSGRAENRPKVQLS